MKLPDLHKRRIAAVLPVRKRDRLASAMRDIEGATLKFWSDMDSESEIRWNDAEIVNESTIRLTPKTRGLWISERTGRRASPGAIPKLALRSYVQSVMVIYEQATGKQIGRTYDAYAEKSKRHPFLLACLRAAGVPRYPHGIIRGALHDLHPQRKLGRPKKGFGG